MKYHWKYKLLVSYFSSGCDLFPKLVSMIISSQRLVVGPFQKREAILPML